MHKGEAVHFDSFVNDDSNNVELHVGAVSDSSLAGHGPLLAYPSSSFSSSSNTTFANEPGLHRHSATVLRRL